MEKDEIDTDYYENLVKNLIWIAPETLLKAVGKGVIAKQTHQYGYEQTAGGIIVAPSATFEKKYNYCEVISVGEEVPDAVQVGDIIILQRSTAFRMPNGIKAAAIWRVMYDTMHIVGVLPNLERSKLSSKYQDGGSLTHVVKTDEYASMVSAFESGTKAVPTF